MNITQEELEKWEQFQNEMKKSVSSENPSDDFFNKIKYVGGVDISFSKSYSNKCCVYLIVLKFSDLSVVYEDYSNETLTIPYLSGFLGFREVPHYKKIIMKLKNLKPELYPDVILVDGFGTLHHRGFGSASHLGIECDVSTIGSAKTLLSLDGLNEKEIKGLFKNKTVESEYELVGQSGTIYGKAVSSNGSNPIYISVGHKINLDTAVNIVKRCSIYRIPEPIRLADIRSKLHFE